MRAVVMIDYGGKLPELQLRLSKFLHILLSHQESSMFENLRVMVIEDMIYLIHLKGIAHLIHSTINKQFELHYVDLQHDPPQMVTEIERSTVGAQFLSLQNLFSSVFCVSTSSPHPPSDVIDLTHFMQDTLVTLPTLNGWLLSYPVVYIFGKDHIQDAVYNLSTKSLHLFSIFVCRNSSSSKRPPEEELMSFSVPYDLSIDGESEVWAEAFLARMKAKWEGCKHVWGSLRMEKEQLEFGELKWLTDYGVFGDEATAEVPQLSASQPISNTASYRNNKFYVPHNNKPRYEIMCNDEHFTVP